MKALGIKHSIVENLYSFHYNHNNGKKHQNVFCLVVNQEKWVSESILIINVNIFQFSAILKLIDCFVGEFCL